MVWAGALAVAVAQTVREARQRATNSLAVAVKAFGCLSFCVVVLCGDIAVTSGEPMELDVELVAKLSKFFTVHFPINVCEGVGSVE